jgi:hypothetical protein
MTWTELTAILPQGWCCGFEGGERGLSNAKKENK